MDTRQAIVEAWGVVESADIPPEARIVAFRELLRLTLHSREPSHESWLASESSTISRSDDQSAEANSAAHRDEATVLRKVSEETEVPISKLERVFHIDDGVVKLIGPSSRYGSSMSEQARSVAKIVSVVRSLGMGESDTPLSVIRVACESRHCYDSKKFAANHMANIDGFVLKGQGRARRLEPKGAGFAAFSDLLEKISGA